MENLILEDFVLEEEIVIIEILDHFKEILKIDQKSVIIANNKGILLVIAQIVNILI